MSLRWLVCSWIIVVIGVPPAASAEESLVFDADAGPRWSDGRSTDVQLALSFPLDLGRRGKRIAAAEADIRGVELEAHDVERISTGVAVTAYYRVLHADRGLALAEERLRLAQSAQTTAEQRSRAGDVPEFEVNLARGEVARARSGVASARSDRIRARSELAAVLGLPGGGGFSVVGDLALPVLRPWPGRRRHETEALPLSSANEIAAAASYRAGKIDLGTLLVIRREVLDTRREHLDRLLDAATAAVDLWIAGGGATNQMTSPTTSGE